jgi:hypothetical protein
MKAFRGIVLAAAAAAGLAMAAEAQEAVQSPSGGVVSKIDNAELPGYLAEKKDYDRIYAVVDGVAIGRDEEKVLVARYIRQGMLVPGALADARPIKNLPGAYTVPSGAWMPSTPVQTGGCNVVVMLYNPRNGKPIEYAPGKHIRCNAEDPEPPPVPAPVEAAATTEAAPAEAAPPAEGAAAAEAAAPTEAAPPAEGAAPTQPPAQ